MVKVSLRLQLLTGGFKSTSSCFIQLYVYTGFIGSILQGKALEIYNNYIYQDLCTASIKFPAINIRNTNQLPIFMLPYESFNLAPRSKFECIRTLSYICPMAKPWPY